MIQRKKNLPEPERPYERCLALGPQVLTDAELIAVVLRTGSKNKGSVEMAHEILKLTGDEPSLADIDKFSIGELQAVPGVGKVKAIQLKVMYEFSRRLWKSRLKERLYFRDSTDIAAYFMEDMRHLDHEELRILYLDLKCRFLGVKILSVGTLKSTLFSTRDIMIEAFRLGAARIVMVHNHPSGDPKASEEDIASTQRVVIAGTIMDVMLLDSIIIGDGVYTSLRQNKRISW
ncbi:DNA repair protein RadC [Lachnospiraceae bacterium]|nr:DNA repair protein RadC [Lachnospiraceae bacterium]